MCEFNGKEQLVTLIFICVTFIRIFLSIQQLIESGNINANTLCNFNAQNLGEVYKIVQFTMDKKNETTSTFISNLELLFIWEKNCLCKHLRCKMTSEPSVFIIIFDEFM